MAILSILQYPDRRLHCKGKMVKDVKLPRIKKIIDDMLETLNAAENCAALAATQLDIKNPPNIVVVSPTCNHAINVLINPQIIAHSGKNIGEEACMSVFPQAGIYAKIERATNITVSALDLAGKKIVFEAYDFFARCIQHECDHLNGIIYPDHLTKIERTLFDKKLIEHGLLAP